jgi:hypothetical protein
MDPSAPENSSRRMAISRAPGTERVVTPLEQFFD